MVRERAAPRIQHVGVPTASDTHHALMHAVPTHTGGRHDERRRSLDQPRPRRGGSRYKGMATLHKELSNHQQQRTSMHATYSTIMQVSSSTQGKGSEG